MRLRTKPIRLAHLPKSIPFALGIISVIMGLQYFLWFPSLSLAILSLVLFLFSFYYGQFFLAGLFIATSAMSQVHLPYQSAFDQCHFVGSVLSASHKMTLIKAKQITCNQKQLPNQTILYRHFQKDDQLITGNNYQFKARLSPISSPRNYDDFNYARYQYLQQILLETKSIDAVQSPKQPIFSFARWRLDLDTMFNAHLSKVNAATVSALITGNRSGIDFKIKQQLQQTGTNHILAISGLHLSIVGAWSFLLFQILFAALPRKVQFTSPIVFAAVMAIICITIYALLSGFLLPVKRAWVMLSLLLLSWIFLKKINTNSLFLAACFILLIDPLAIQQVSFYFSFIATYIVLRVLQTDFSFFARIILIQFLISLTLLPITWFIFGQISLMSIPSNLLIIPWISLWVIPSAFLSIFAELLTPAFADIFWSFTNFSVDALQIILRLFANLHLLLTPTFIPSKVVVILSVMLLITATAFLNRKSFIFIAFGVLILFIPINTPQPAIIIADSKNTSVLIYNQKSAILIDPGRKYKQIDSAKKWIRYLKLNHLELKLIILTGEQLSKISATSSLISAYPDAKITTLRHFDFPYQTSFCQTKIPPLKNISISLQLDQSQCHLIIDWFDHLITFDPKYSKPGNLLINSSSLEILGKTYKAQNLGAIKITPKLNIYHP